MQPVTSTTPERLPPTTHLAQRLNHPHYYANSALCLPLPAVLVSSSRASTALTTALLATPVLLSLSAALRKRSENLETLHASTTSQLRLFNLCGLFFCRKPLGISGWWTLAYLSAWLAVSFFLPQPDYLGPSKMRALNGEEFETQILLLPPTSTFSSDSTGATPSPTLAHLVHFHVPHSSTSRDLQMTLSRLSAQYASPSLSFSVLDASADENQGACYDLGLATGPTSRDVPLVRLYVGGKVRAEAPASEGEARRAVRRRRLAEKKARKGGRASEESEEDESEDEREVEQERALSRYRWDTSAAAIERTFKLRERSGLATAAAPS
ncbi:uncharacterized protein RHOBADRAFT_55708 [Rhodotorula graminis WP1]|uniref:Uncharacterized protein n=1 Tax=Rhodotorula graminis (strain WP1) TaxID=578459 RepID=A0A0P9GZ07_RHOGW|nr:uncharacterized protein RHOBADRAFT_55708 [Rhodotorula graminis WP1]KPV72611.1 hypothetical protein RHOBADRAFT_55708 [Rhodotorula graminis WP1]